MKNGMIIWLTVILGVLVVTLTAGAQDEPAMILSEPVPVFGREQTVSLRIPRPVKASLTVTYRPNSATAKEEEAGAFSEEGALPWTPESPGIATLTARDEGGVILAELHVAICFAETPFYGVVVMVLAGLLLFGGAGLSLALALKGS